MREDAGGWARAVRTWGQVVRLRPKEPDGWLALARAQTKAGDGTAARTTLDTIRKTPWDERFGDVRAKADALRKDVP
ncbi:MAG TPA: tetratricopeptide repeat protein, partial [Planctomycetota bacterium]|nr:tetratricopeptide repeat protein [Planctomycetota bacterium]